MLDPRGAERARRGPALLGRSLGAFVLLLALSGPAQAQAIRVGSFVKNSTTGNQVVPHGLGQTPKALILWTNGKTDENFSANFLYAFGMADGTTSKSVAAASQGGVTPSNASRRLADKALTIVQWGEGLVAEANLASWDATNFTLNWTTNTAATGYVVHFIAIGGAGVSAKVVEWSMKTTTGTQGVATVGFTPDVVLHAHLGDSFTSASGTSLAGASLGIGAMDKDGSQWAQAALSVDAAGTADTQRGQQTDGCLHTINNSLGVQTKAAFSAMDANGFSLNFTTASGSAGKVVSLALKGVAAKAGSFAKTTTVPPAGAYVQSASNDYGSASSATLALPAVGTGDLIVVSVNYPNTFTSVSSVTDDRGNTYRRVFGPTDWTYRMYTYYAKNVTGGATNITVALSGGSGGWFEVYATEYRGLDTVDPLDQVSETISTANPLASGAVTTSYPDELLYAFCETVGALTVNAPFTGRNFLNSNFVADRTVTAIGTYSVTATKSSGTDNWSCHLLSFRHAGAAQPITGVGFSPEAVLLASAQDVTQANPVAESRLGVGATDRYFNQGSSALADRNGVGTSSVQGVDKTSRAFVKVDNATSTINAEAVLYSTDRDGFTIDWTANDAVATEMLYLALGASKPASYGRLRTITIPTGSLGASAPRASRTSPSSSSCRTTRS